MSRDRLEGAVAWLRVPAARGGLGLTVTDVLRVLPQSAASGLAPAVFVPDSVLSAHPLMHGPRPEEGSGSRPTSVPASAVHDGDGRLPTGTRLWGAADHGARDPR